jgi:hypothetical protein
VPDQLFKNRFGSQIRINKFGFRGPDYAYEKAAGTLRLAVFGESSAFCYNSADEKSWPGALRSKLERRLGMPVEVINLALPGFDIFHSKVNYMAFGRAFRPDAIVVYHTWNDMKNFRSLESLPYRPRGAITNKPVWQRLARQTQIGRRARNAMFVATGRRLENQYKAEEGTGARADRPIDRKAFEWERQNFRDLVMLAESDGVLPILVSQGTLASREALADRDVRLASAEAAGLVGMTMPLVADTWLQVSGLIEGVARERDAVFVDGYRGVPRDLRHFEDYVHLWDMGSEALAETIAGTLVNDPRFLHVAARAGRTAVVHSGTDAPSGRAN